MTELFAATVAAVAAVAPILVLVGTVEANALVKRVKESEAERDAPLRAAMKLIQSEGHDVLRGTARTRPKGYVGSCRLSWSERRARRARTALA
ncbi:hypothetical protein [Streptomyces chartreusis]|uniref:hypothetical protein n=1 Tax=Streptomyces chartreusis TaxID=1969 RepID=UPI0035DD34ED